MSINNWKLLDKQTNFKNTPKLGKAVLWELITLLAREETKESYKTAGKPICCRACLMMQHKLLGMQGTSGD